MFGAWQHSVNPWEEKVEFRGLLPATEYFVSKL